MRANQNNDNHINSVALGVKNLNVIGNNDKVFTVKMLNTFLTSATDCIEGIRRSLEQNDWLDLRNIAHKNIPSYKIMGLNELADFLKYLENNALKKDKHKQVSEKARSLYEKNEDVIAAIKKYLDLIYLEDLRLSIN